MPNIKPNNRVAVKACRNMLRAPCASFAPILCAPCTENPVEHATHKPPNSHMVVDTNPIEAEASAPKLPTIDASIYCMTIDDNCATMAGTLSQNTNSNWLRLVICWPLLI